MYVEFRPQADGWGKRSEVRCAKVLDLRRKETTDLAPEGGGTFQDVRPVVKVEAPLNNQLEAEEESHEPRAKRGRVGAEDASEAT